MVITEKEHLEELFFRDGSIKAEFTPVFSNISFIGKQVRKDTGIVLHDTFQEKFEGIADTKGNYIFVRYNGKKHFKNDILITPLRLCVGLIDRIDIENVTLNVCAYIKKWGKVFNDFEIELNTWRVFVEETGLPIEKLQKPIYLSYIDFNSYTHLPNCLNFD